MNTYIQIATSIIAFLSLFTLIPFPAILVGRIMWQPNRSIIRRILDIPALMLFMPILPVKILVGVMPVIMAVIAGLGVFAGILIRDWLTALTGLIGFVLFSKLSYDITRPVPGFAEAFGPEWEENIFTENKIGSTTKSYQFPFSKKPSFKSTIHRNIGIPTDDNVSKTVLCDIWEPGPELSRSGLAVIHLHATAWQAMDKGQLVKDLFSRINAQGHLVLDLAYSLAPKANLEQMVIEVKTAIGWLKSKADGYQIN